LGIWIAMSGVISAVVSCWVLHHATVVVILCSELFARRCCFSGISEVASKVAWLKIVVWCWPGSGMVAW